VGAALGDLQEPVDLAPVPEPRTGQGSSGTGVFDPGTAVDGSGIDR
jgi:hypothetical protein